MLRRTRCPARSVSPPLPQAGYRVGHQFPAVWPRRNPWPEVEFQPQGGALLGWRRRPQHPQLPFPGRHFRNRTGRIRCPLTTYRGWPRPRERPFVGPRDRWIKRHRGLLPVRSDKAALHDGRAARVDVAGGTLADLSQSGPAPGSARFWVSAWSYARPREQRSADLNKGSKANHHLLERGRGACRPSRSPTMIAPQCRPSFSALCDLLASDWDHARRNWTLTHLAAWPDLVGQDWPR